MNVKRMVYSDTSLDRFALGTQADELMIANMLNALNNPHILKMLNDEELKLVLQVVKNHVVLKADMALEEQRVYVDSNGRSR